MLLLALFFIVVAASLATLIMANSSQLIATTRHEHEVIVLRQLTDSGLAWALAQGGVKADAPAVLGGDGILPAGVRGEVRLSRDEKAPDVIVIIAEVAFPRHNSSRTTRYRMP